MRIVMTLCVKDEGDILDAHLAFHLRAGVDFVIATDSGSKDASVEILQRYADAGFVHLLHDHRRPFQHARVATRMARLAAAEFGADWVINSDADEFWLPRGPGLKETLAAIPPKYGIIRCVWRSFVPRPESEAPFQERMTVRLVAPEPINDPASAYRPSSKIAHRADPDVRLVRGNHGLVNSPLIPLRGWSPIEVLHFPLRSTEQMLRKYDPTRYGGIAKTGFVRRFGGTGGTAAFDQLVVSDEQVRTGLTSGVLAVDLRLRDLLARVPVREEGGFGLPTDSRPQFELETPSIVDDALYAQDIAALGDSDLVRAQRRMDTLEQMLAARSAPASIRLARRVYRQRHWLLQSRRK
jgi:glycosyl transferase family 2